MWWCCANCTKFLSASRYVHHYAPICYKINDNWHSVSGGDSIHCDRRLDQMRSWICVSLSSVVTGSCRLCHSSEKRISWSAHVPFLYLSVVVCYICAGTDPRWSGTWNPKQGWGQTRRNDDIHCICTEASCQTWKWLMKVIDAGILWSEADLPAARVLGSDWIDARLCQSTAKPGQHQLRVSGLIVN